MKKFTLLFSLLLAFCGTVKAQTTTQITEADLTEDNNRMVYYITTQDGAVRGALYTPFNDDNTPVGRLASCGASAANYGAYKNVAMNPLDEKQHYAIITYKGKKYLYSVAAGMFSYNSTNYAELTTDPALIVYVTVPVNGNYLQIKYQGQKRISFSNNYAAWNAIWTNFGSDDNGNRLVISKVKETAESADFIQLTDDQYNNAMGILRKIYLNELVVRADSLMDAHAADAVGYPNGTARAALTTAKETAAGQAAATAEGATEDMVAAMETAIDAYYATTEVNLPVEGKAYKIKALYANGTYRYVKFDESLATKRLNVSTTEPTDNSGVFVCKTLGDGNVALVNPMGGFMAYIADGKFSPSGSTTGFVTSYLPEDVTINLSHQKTQNLYGSTTITDKVFGSLSVQIQARVGGRYYLMAGESNFHNQNANTLAFNNIRSSFFYFEEVENPACNKPVLNAAAGIGDGSKNIATFSAVVPTVVPEGVQAYTVNTDENPAFAKAALLAEAGQAIPASTGVILYGENAGQVTMTPATTETVAAVEGHNQLQATAGVAQTAKPAAGTSLLLGKKNDLVAFYGWADGTNLGMNKAYLQLTEGQSASTIRLNFGDTTTGIENVETVSGKTVIFDLSGRRVMNPVKGGIYIRNGKKVIL